MKKGLIIIGGVLLLGSIGTGGYLMMTNDANTQEVVEEQPVQEETQENKQPNQNYDRQDYSYDDLAEEENSSNTLPKETASRSISYKPKVYTRYEVDRQAQFPGGFSKMKDFIQENQQITPAAYADGTSGTVVVEFDVNADGSLDQYDVIETPGAGLGVEAVRIFQIMPNWDPAKIGNQKVACRTQISVPFKSREVVIESQKDSKYF